MSKKWFSLFCVLLLAIIATACNAQSESSFSLNNSTSNRNTMHADQSSQDLEQYRKFINPFAYQIGWTSWDHAEDIEPDAFVIYYFYMGTTDEVEISSNYPKDKEYGNPLIPADILEQFVQMHFDVTAEHIRNSQYYDSKLHAYWTGGIGTTADLSVINVEIQNNTIIIHYSGKIENSEFTENWIGNVVVKEQEGDYKYLSYRKEVITN